jgi:hypothetical protein
MELDGWRDGGMDGRSAGRFGWLVGWFYQSVSHLVDVALEYL